MQEAPFSTTFVLYLNGLRCSHTVRSESGHEEHVGDICKLVESLQSHGWSVNEAGVPEDCHKEEADGYVVGEDAKGNPKLWFYRAGLQYVVRGGTVYHDHFESLPFEVDMSRRVEQTQAPERPRAEEKGWLRPCKVDVISKKSGKTTDSGKEIYRCQQVVPRGQQPKPAEKERAKAKPTPEQLKEKIIAFVASDDVKTQADIADAFDRAKRHEEYLGDHWGDCKKAFRSRFVSELNLADNTKAVGAYASCLMLASRIKGVFGEKDYEEIVETLQSKKREAAEAEAAESESDYAAAEVADPDF